MYENRRFELPIGPKPFDILEYTAQVPLNNNNATVLYGKIYDTPGNTPLNRAEGALREEPGKFYPEGTNQWRRMFNMQGEW